MLFARTILLLAAGIAAGLGGVACQDYPFEEVLWNVFEVESELKCVPVNTEVDILFVVDNSNSMAGEQLQLARSFKEFAASLNEYFDENKYRIAIVTTGMDSDRCRACTEQVSYGCINETGENGRFQDRLGHITWADPEPEFDFLSDPHCRVVSSGNLDCFYDEVQDRGTVLVGVSGCGFERGLEGMRQALSQDLLGSHNNGFLREDATLAVIVVSDEEDCGKVGEVTETIGSAAAWPCYYAAIGIGPDGSSYHPDDSMRREYKLTPVKEYFDFLVDLKGGHQEMVKFAAIVGLKDRNDPWGTTIEYLDDGPSAGVATACRTPNCQGSHCEAWPGTRYVELASMFGDLGFVDTICQENFFATMRKLGGLITCPKVFTLDREIFDLDLVAFQVNGETVPRYTCERSLAACGGIDDEACAPGVCLETWRYLPPVNPGSKAKIVLGDHYNPCAISSDPEVCLELFYVPE